MSLFSTHWYRVANLAPSLCGHIRIERHTYRGQTWYVLQDLMTNRQHRFSSDAHSFIGMLDGTRTLDAIWTGLNDTLGDDAPTQDEIIGLLGRLHAAGVLNSDFSPESIGLFQRQNRQRNMWRQAIRNPMSLRIPLVDPDRLLNNLLKRVPALVFKLIPLFWLCCVLTGGILGAMHWQEISHNLTDRILRPENLLLLWLIYPTIKILHEFGHGLTARYQGAEVHEMGIMVLGVMIVPYVDVSASAGFPEKRKRILVSGAGIATELLIASLSILVWLMVEPGKISAIAYNVILVGGISTLFVNGNPLSRYDGYFILADWLEIPNLARRSSQYYEYLCRRYLLRLPDAQSPVSAPGESIWFVLYGLASYVYRLFALGMLALFIGKDYPSLGLVILGWTILTRVLVPGYRLWHNLLSASSLEGKRTSFLGSTTVAAVATVFCLFVLPFPLRTHIEGVVDLSERSRLRTGTDCVVRSVNFSEGSSVEADASVIECDDPYLQAEVNVLEANLLEKQAKYQIESLQSRRDREIQQKDVDKAQAELSRAKERFERLTLRSPHRGILILPEGEKLTGRFVKQGNLIGYIASSDQAIVTAVVGQDDISIIRQKTRAIKLTLVSQPGQIHTLSTFRETPAARDDLPHPALGLSGGGSVPVDPTDNRGLRSMNKFFQLEISLPLSPEQLHIGERVHILLDNGYEPIGYQWVRSLKQLFLRQFHA